MRKRKYILLFLILLLFFIPGGFVMAQEATPSTVPTPTPTEQTTTPGEEKNASMDANGNIKQTIPDTETEVNLSLPPELEGYEVEIKNENGDVVGKTKLDVRGAGKVLIPRGAQIFLNLTSNQPIALNSSKNEMQTTVFDVIKWTLGGIIITAIVTYFITRKKTMEKFRDAVDVIYNEDLDD